MIAALLLGASQAITSGLFQPVSLQQHLQDTPVVILGVLLLCLALAFFSLWQAAPDYRVFRSMSIFLAIVGAQNFWDYFGGGVSNWAPLCFGVAMLVQTAAEAMRIRNRRWVLVIWPVSTAVFLLGWDPSRAYIREWPVDLSEVMLGVLIVLAVLHGDRRDRLIAAAFSLHFVVRATLSPGIQRFTGFRAYIILGGWKWQITTVTVTLMGFATLAIFVRDLIRDRREKQRMAAELEAGRAVQQLLVSDAAGRSFPGFQIEAAYRPFSEVGGDFFQILPLEDGDVVIAIGDVSGKGLAAGLTVSLLLGTLQATVEKNSTPSKILGALNRSLYGRNRGGFTTCLVLRASRDGNILLANAGHLPPYRSGIETPLESGFPLGITPHATYSDNEFQIGPSDQLTLLTDGVVEARDKRGELFGFERTAALSRDSAEAQIKAAQDFGQEDDITVVTLQLAHPQPEFEKLGPWQEATSSR